MKVRIKFSKTGALVYIGHLDVMRYFQKLFRRSDIPIAYSEGFSPHQILSFSHPLPLGMASYGEYADIEITEAISSKEAIARLKVESVPEIEILSFKELPQKHENAMASVRAARYDLDFTGYNPFENIERIPEILLSKDSIVVTKVTKKTTKEEDIRPYIYECKYSNGHIEMLISSGSAHNLKPELVMKAAAELENVELDEDELQMVRVEQYTIIDDKFLSLNDVGTDIL